MVIVINSYPFYILLLLSFKFTDTVSEGSIISSHVITKSSVIFFEYLLISQDHVLGLYT